MPRLVALIRGINVGATRKLPMAALRAACAEIGLGAVETYIQSGNLLLDHDDPAAAEAAIETLVRDRFGLDVPVIARTAAQWRALIAACPLPHAARDDPRRLHLLVCKRPPATGARDALAARAGPGESVAACGGDLVIHYAGGFAATRLTPTILDRTIGSPVTARNWNTVTTLAGLAG